MELLGVLLGWLFNWSHDPNDPSEHGNADAYPFRDMRQEKTMTDHESQYDPQLQSGSLKR
jgi:hypothetical protein